MTERFLKATAIAAPAADVFAWHARPGAFERLVPPWESLRVIRRTGGIEDGATAVLQLRAGPVPVTWTARHRDHVPGRQFADEQVGGPFASWLHTHRFHSSGDTSCLLEDDLAYALPFGPLGRLAAGRAVRARLERTFRFRHEVTRADIQQHLRYAGPRMRIAITGASGLLGSHLVPFLTTGGHEVVRLLRGGPLGPGTAAWNPETGAVDEPALGAVDAVVHLAGVGIADQRWTPAYKNQIAASRIGPTRALCEWLASRQPRPGVLVCASATGFYGNRGDEVVDESSPPGAGFLPEVCVSWERAAQAARDAGIRVVHLRTGVVLTPRGGALKKMLPAFRVGLGGPIGPGTQYMSWVSIDDLVGAAFHAITTPGLDGPVNVTAPNPVTNARFSEVLAGVLQRPAVFRMPALAVRTVFGEMGEALLLEGQRVVPTALLGAGYAFRHANLEDALRHLLGR